MSEKEQSCYDIELKFIENDIRLREKELELKWAKFRAEQATKSRTIKYAFSPLLTTIIAIASAVLGTIIGAGIQGIFNLKLEQKKLESNLILKAIQTGDQNESAQNLLFLAEIGLISDYDGRIVSLRDKPDKAPVLPPVTALNERSYAKSWEEEGFKAIRNRNIEQAIYAFAKSEEIWSIYHNVSEIHDLLIKMQSELTAGTPKQIEKAWENLSNVIVSKYSFGMPSRHQIWEAQRMLKELGFYQEEQTGYLDNTTIEAISAFQKSCNLDVDGRLGTETMITLIREISKSDRSP